MSRWFVATGTVLGRALRHLVVGPGQALVLAALIWLGWPWSGVAILTLVALAIGGVVLWRTWTESPSPFARACLGRVARRRIRSTWSDACTACGLARPANGDELPAIRAVSGAWPHVALRVRPLLGQTEADFVDAAEVLRTAMDASRLRIEPAGTRELNLTFTVGDPLALPHDAAVPDVSGNDRVYVGCREDGTPWHLVLGPHTLVAGCSGAGKGSVFWSFAFGLARQVHEGVVRLHGIDLKGGMEVLMGEPLFSSTATDATSAVALLEHLVDRMNERTKSYAGRVRSHEASIEEPLEVVMIDELAALTAYCSDRDLQRRADVAINLLCSQGRAPGFVVFACLQDPRKEVIPSRGLFTQTIGLRLKDRSETSMVLGDVAVETGALCHRIPRTLPGVGYVAAEDLHHPVRVRAGYASDDLIRDVAERFATPSILNVPPLRASLDGRRSARLREIAP